MAAASAGACACFISDTHVKIECFSRTTPIAEDDEKKKMIERRGFRRSSYTAGTSTGNSVFLDEATERILARAKDHSWTREDVASALLQTALMSYRSTAHAVKVYGDERYVESYPEDYRHNCPWNDWVPPSVSEHVFQEAPANKEPHMEPIRRRVRVRVSPFKTRTKSSLIAFASIEMGSSGAPCLRLRRGANILGSITLSSLKTERIGDLIIGLLEADGKVPRAAACVPAEAIQGPTPPSIYLHFENSLRVTKFCALVSQGRACEKE
jgi:hypothetical protein